MDDLKQIYRQAISGRIRALETALVSLGSEPAEAAESIRRVAHSLKGSGATYGFPEVSSAAAVAEAAADSELATATNALLEVLRGIAVESRGARVLVVDDDPEMQLLLRAIVSRPEREIVIADTAAAAQSRLGEGTFDLVLLDLLLPDADGRKLLLWIREQPNAAAVPVFILSGKTSSQARSECFALGADGFFEKPFDPEVVAAAIDTQLARGVPDEAERKAARQAARFQAFCDHNGALLQRSRERDEPVAIAALRPLGGNHIHAESPAELLQRSSDVLTGLAGERFGRRADDILYIVLPGLTAARAAVEAASLRKQLRSGLQRRKREHVVHFAAAVVEVDATESFSDALERVESSVRATDSNADVTIAERRERNDGIILLAEDDDLVASIVKHRLGRAGWEVMHHADGVEARAAIQRGGFGLVILDVKLPGVDGFELLEEIRRNPLTERIPVIMLTALGGERDVVHGLQLGANDYIAKPFSPVELLARVRRLLGQ